jgi:hypothetical protein
MADYSLDLAATNPANYITDTYRRGTGAWIFVPVAGAFFTRDLVLTNTVNGRQLEPQTQYRALHTQKEATWDSAKEVCTVLVILDAAVNEVAVTRRVVGGKFQIVGSDVEKIITEEDINNINSSTWGQVIGQPYQFPFDPHKHYTEDVYGLEHVVYLLDEIRGSIGTGDKNAFGMVYQFIDKQFTVLSEETDTKLKQIESIIDNIEGNRKWKPGVIVAMTNNTNPATAIGYGTWRKLTNTLLYGVNLDSELGQRKKVGEGPDYLMTGVYYWELVSV